MKADEIVQHCSREPAFIIHLQMDEQKQFNEEFGWQKTMSNSLTLWKEVQAVTAIKLVSQTNI